MLIREAKNVGILQFRMRNQRLTTFQCCLSDQHWSDFPGFGSGSILGMRIRNPRSMKIDIVMFCDLLSRRSIVFRSLSCKNLTFSDGKVLPGSRSALVKLPGSVSGSTLSYKPGSGYALKLIRIHKSAIFIFLEFIYSTGSSHVPITWMWGVNSSIGDGIC